MPCVGQNANQPVVEGCAEVQSTVPPVTHSTHYGGFPVGSGVTLALAHCQVEPHLAIFRGWNSLAPGTQAHSLTTGSQGRTGVRVDDKKKARWGCPRYLSTTNSMGQELFASEQYEAFLPHQPHCQ